MRVSPRVIVVGAGAFGGWSALTLLRQGAQVTLIDAWGPGHARASSGGDTRIIRATYGPRRIYTRMAARAMRLWRDEDARWGHGCLRPSSAIWMSGADTGFADQSEAALADEGLAVERLDPGEAARRWPQIDFNGIGSVLHEPDAGFLYARRACALVAAQFVREGGTYIQGRLTTPCDPTHPMLDDGSCLDADVIVIAAGPWMGEIFPELLGMRVTATRQAVHYFGVPAGVRGFEAPDLPIWLELGSAVMYGIPGDDHRGFKIADDTSGPVIDPSTMERTISAEEIDRVRTYLGRRFPRLSGAPWVAGEVCQYESTPDSHFIIDTHPDNAHIWIAGGGSGHGFKMGPAVGEIVADAVFGRIAPDPTFSLHRFAASPFNDTKWS